MIQEYMVSQLVPLKAAAQLGLRRPPSTCPAGTPEAANNLLEESDSHELMAERTRLLFYGVIQLPMRLRDIKTVEVFVVSYTSDGAILRMPFLVAQGCVIKCQQSVVTVNGCSLTCMDRYGQLLLSKVQVVSDVVVPARTERAVPCRMLTRITDHWKRTKAVRMGYYWLRA